MTQDPLNPDFPAVTPTRPVLRYHGGKWMLAPWILAHLPPHRVYTEPYGGAASVLMRKPRARLVEVYNDLDGEIVNLFRLLRDTGTAGVLREVLRGTPFARDEFLLSYEPSVDPIEQARRTVVRSFFGFGSDSASGATTGFRANGNRNNAHPARDFANYPDAMEAFTERLRGVVIENRPALEIIRQHDGPEALHYCDPPYTHGARSDHTVRTGKGYRHEMTDDEHRELAEVLHDAAGMVAVSGYPSPLYDELYGDWRVSERRAIADGGPHAPALERTEVLWLNPACVAALEASRQQSRMFA
jgi:DNA adenine methylase